LNNNHVLKLAEKTEKRAQFVRNRRAAVEDVKGGLSAYKAAQKYSIPYATVKRDCKGGKMNPRGNPGHISGEVRSFNKIIYSVSKFVLIKKL
jgi:hypothetical protein